MKKKFLLMVPAICLLSACNNSENTPEEPDVNPQPTVTDLSADEMANCYIVRETGKYRFKADNQFNLGAGLPVPPEINPVDASLLWQTKQGAVRSVELVVEDDIPYVEFEVAHSEGNAVIAVYDADKKICWSWHIWMPLEEVMAVTSASGYEVMNMNLGALNNNAGDASSYGLLYQWGRKDPFPAAATLTGNTSTVSAPMYDMDGTPVTIKNSDWYSSEDNTIEYSISNPLVCLSNMSQFRSSGDWLKDSDSDDTLWGYLGDGSEETVLKGKKTCYDPSPAGWRVPDSDVFNHFTFPGTYAWDFWDFNVWDANADGDITLDDYNYGWHFMINDESPMYFPAAARFDGSYAMLMGSVSGIWGNYWSCTPASSSYSSKTGMAVCALAFQVKDQNGGEMITVSPSGLASRADAYSIRCVKDVE